MEAKGILLLSKGKTFIPQFFQGLNPQTRKCRCNRRPALSSVYFTSFASVQWIRSELLFWAVEGFWYRRIIRLLTWVNYVRRVLLQVFLDTGLFTRDSTWLLQWCFLWVTRCSETWWGFEKNKNYYGGAEGRRFSTGFLWVVVLSIQIMDHPSFLNWKCVCKGDFLIFFLGIPHHSLNSWRATHSLWCIFNEKPVTIPLMKYYRSLAWESRLIVLHLGYKTSTCL